MPTTVARVAPIFPVRNVNAALDHYRRLGFDVKAYGEKAADDPIYGFANRGTIELHLARNPSLDPAANTSACYLYVESADSLYEEWRAAGATGRLDAPVDTPYGLREMIHVDPDGNLLRIGSPP